MTAESFFDICTNTCRHFEWLHIPRTDIHIWINLELQWSAEEMLPISHCQWWNKGFYWWLEERKSSHIYTLIIDHLLCPERILTMVLMMFGCATVLHLQLAHWVQIYMHWNLTATCLINKKPPPPPSQESLESATRTGTKTPGSVWRSVQFF